MRSFEALISAQYHVGNLRPKQRRVAPRETHPSRISKTLHPLGTAAQAIANHPRNPSWAHATAVLGEAYWWTLRAGDPSGLPELEKHLVNALSGTGLAPKTIGNLPEEQVLLHVYGALRRLKTGATLKVLEDEVDGLGVSRFAASIAHDETKTIEQIAQEGDPTAWAQKYPEVFADAHLINDPVPDQCRDRYVDPPPSTLVRQLGDPFDGVLFEDARFGGIVTFRNLLRIKYKVQGHGHTGTVAIEYGLHECLSNALPGEAPQAGGLDVDRSSDPCEANPVAKCLVTLDAGHVVTTAAKHVRFSDDAVFSDALNAMARPLLATFIIGLLLGSVVV